MTWRAVAKIKNSANTNLLILDETFDSSLDANGTEDLMKILQLLEDVNLFVISHKGDVLQDKFMNVIKFRKDRLINDRKCFKDEREIQNHINFIEEEIKVSEKNSRMIELKNWLNSLKAVA